MKVVEKQGRCIECGQLTKITLDNGKYACGACLNRVGKETRNVREFMAQHNTQYNDVFVENLLSLLKVMKENNIRTTDNIIKTVEAIKYYEKIAEMIKDNLDILNER